MPSFPDEVLEHVLVFLTSSQDRNSVSLVCKTWYRAEAWGRKSIFIRNMYAVSAEAVVRRFPRLRSITLKGKPRFADFNLVPPNWGADVLPWIHTIASVNPMLEELRLKRMVVTDESLELLAHFFPNFRALSLTSCEGFSTNGLAIIASKCRNLTELDLQENDIDDRGGYWLSCFPESCSSLVSLNFACLNSEVNFDVLERLVARCKCLKSLKLNKNVTLEQLQRLLVRAPQLTELGTGSYSQELKSQQFSDLETAFSNCRDLRLLSGFWEVSSLYLSAINSVCVKLTFLNFSYATLQSWELGRLIVNCPHLQRLWVLDTVEDKGLETVSSSCKDLRELRVFPADPSGQGQGYVTEKGIVAISKGCPNLKYVLYFCRQMTNSAIVRVAHNCPMLTHFRLCIMDPHRPDHQTNEPMDEAFGAIVKNCKNLQRLSLSGLLTDKTFEYLGLYAKNLQTLSVAFAGDSDKGMQYLLQGCPKLRKLEIRDSPFGDAALLSGLDRYESMRSLWMSACHVTLNGCNILAQEMPKLNVEIIKENDEDDDNRIEKLYVYRTLCGPRTDAPSFVYTL
ncbi:protein TRANSPORT INHIBITOR RESPONSE 1 [Cryptomeria japonica]|uniref:protein TRANSPORT INHIBITOR RESPONSE 1 n=1 Tax=Cryptomeria japonica TaxID=3369 RepID=UPI0027DA7FD8|nr:protein TRANSPORT INHIBITOR RESPONSE 1 [Cryptomeria japonica]